MRSLALFCIAFAFAGSASAREKLHMWTDASGVVHVEDAEPWGNAANVPAAKKKFKSTGAQKKKSSRPPASKASSPQASRWWEHTTDAPPDQIDRAAETYQIPAELIRAVISVESAGDTSAVSRTGAKGLMQLMPQTAGHVYVDDPVDPAQNILGGTRYLRELANQFDGDMILMLAAYNAGPDNVRKYHGVPPFEETRGYVRKVMAHYNELKHEAAMHAQVASAAPAPSSLAPRSNATGAQGRSP